MRILDLKGLVSLPSRVVQYPVLAVRPASAADLARAKVPQKFLFRIRSVRSLPLPEKSVPKNLDTLSQIK
jgi:hypothetical protein